MARRERPHTRLCPHHPTRLPPQAIRTLARNADPRGTRTIGVLTKPDKVDEGPPQDALISILRGERYQLRLGYYAVRTPMQAELEQFAAQDMLPSAAFDAAREIEARFFETHTTGLKLQQAVGEQCGSSKLLARLSGMLRQMIDSQVPAMKVQLAAALAHSKEQLAALGEAVPAEQAQQRCLQLVREISNETRDRVEARGSDKSFWQGVMEAFSSTRKEMSAAAPTFCLGGRLYLWESRDHARDSDGFFVQRGVLDVDDALALFKKHETALTCEYSQEFALGGCVWQIFLFPAPRNGRSDNIGIKCVRLPVGVSTVEIRFRITMPGFSGASTQAVACSAQQELALNVPRSTKLTSQRFAMTAAIDIQKYNPSQGSCAMSVANVKQIIALGRGRVIPLPGTATYSAVDEIATNSVQGWEQPSLAFVQEVERRLHILMLGDGTGDAPIGIVQKATQPYGFLRERLAEGVRTALKQRTCDATERVAELLTIETGGSMYTANTHYLAENRRMYSADLRAMLDGGAVSDAVASLAEEKRSELKALLGQINLTPSSLNHIPLGNSCDDEALEVMAGALAYFRVTFKYYTDALSKHTYLLLLDRFAKGIHDDLCGQLKLFSSTGPELAALFKEDDATARRRSMLADNVLRQEKGLGLIGQYLENAGHKQAHAGTYELV